MIVPVGLTNAHHEPINFFGTVRPEGETTILPSTWHDTGLAIFGTVGKGYATFDYQAMVVAGLNANGFNRDEWVAGGKQGFFEEDNFTSPGYAFRVDYRGVPGLRVGRFVLATVPTPLPTPTSRQSTDARAEASTRLPCASIRPTCSISTNMSRHVPTSFTAIWATRRPSVTTTAACPTIRLIAA